MNDWDLRDCVVEEVRYLMGGGYRRHEIPLVEAGIDRLWDDAQWWAKAITLKLDRVISELARGQD